MPRRKQRLVSIERSVSPTFPSLYGSSLSSSLFGSTFNSTAEVSRQISIDIDDDDGDGGSEQRVKKKQRFVEVDGPVHGEQDDPFQHASSSFDFGGDFPDTSDMIDMHSPAGSESGVLDEDEQEELVARFGPRMTIDDSSDEEDENGEGGTSLVQAVASKAEKAKKVCSLCCCTI